MTTNITNDSREVRRGDTFIAVRGHDIDGYRFIGDAISRGAKTIVSEKDFAAPMGIKKIIVKDSRAALPIIADKFYGHPSKKLKVIGITGTNGKTTITYLVENILKKRGNTPGVIGTINYRYKGKVMPSNNTTPGPLELQAMLARMLKASVDYVIMEVSSHSLDQRRVDRVSFDTALFTNVTSDHLDYHKTAEEYFKAKAKLFSHLKGNGVAILNDDDKKVRALKRSIRRKVITYGLEKGADITAKDISSSADGSSFMVVTPKGSVLIKTKLVGRHNISNILASAAIALVHNIKLNDIRKGIETFKTVPGRLESVDAGQSFKIFIDYAHTEDALFNVLSFLRELSVPGKIITVFGCGGNRDKTKRPLMGKVACKFSDRVIITSDNPRFEEPSTIINDIEKGVKDLFFNYNIVEDRRKAIEEALSLASDDDIVLIAGKGHEKYQIIKDKIIPFDDCDMVKSVLERAHK